MVRAAATRKKQDKFAILDAISQFEPDFKASVGALGAAVIYFDLDNFKSLNTRFTETVIDRDLLPELQRLIARLVTARGYAYAEGGDEFVVLMPNTNVVIAKSFAQVLIETIRETEFCVAGESVHVTASAGVAASSDPEKANHVRERANQGKARAKANGKDRVEVVDSSTSAKNVGGTFEISVNPSLILVGSNLVGLVRFDEDDDGVSATVTPDAASELELKAMRRRGEIDLAYRNTIVRGTLEDIKFSHEGAQQRAVLLVKKRQGNGNAMMLEMAYGGSGAERMDANKIAELRASRLLTGDPRAPEGRQFHMGPESLISGGHGDALRVDRSPIPDFLVGRAREMRATWDHLRLELVRQLLLSNSVQTIESLNLQTVRGRLVRVALRGQRRPYDTMPPHAVAIERDVDF